MEEFSTKKQLARVAAGLTGSAPFFANPQPMRPMRFVEGWPENSRAKETQNIPQGTPTAPWGSRHIR